MFKQTFIFLWFYVFFERLGQLLAPMMAPKKSWPGPGWPKRQGISMVLDFVPLFFLYLFYVYCAQLHIPSLLRIFRNDYVSQGLPGTAQGGARSLIPILKYVRMSGTIMPHSFID